MKVYFVRHAESHANASGSHDFPDVGLTVTGERQAEIVAKRFASIPVEVIVSSHYTRAEQTAAIINRHIQKKILYTSLLKEAVVPSEILSMPPQSKEVLAIRELIRSHRNDPDWHYSDEENFYDVRNRAIEALMYLRNLPYQHILVVTHGTFLRMLIGVMIFHDTLLPDMHLSLSHFLTTINTGITVCEVGDSGVWRLITWNDHAHLG